MSREREILQASCKYSYTVNEEKHFQKAARWADATMIERACAFLFAKTKMSGSEIAAFRKAMEE